MQYSTLGRTELSVSRICLGTMTYGEQNTEAEGHEQLDYALAQGVNFIDTAEMYPIAPAEQTQGATERIIGSWLAKRKQRQDIILASKASGPAQWPWRMFTGRRFYAVRLLAQHQCSSLKPISIVLIYLYQRRFLKKLSVFILITQIHHLRIYRYRFTKARTSDWNILKSLVIFARFNDFDIFV